MWRGFRVPGAFVLVVFGGISTSAVNETTFIQETAGQGTGSGKGSAVVAGRGRAAVGNPHGLTWGFVRRCGIVGGGWYIRWVGLSGAERGFVAPRWCVVTDRRGRRKRGKRRAQGQRQLIGVGLGLAVLLTVGVVRWLSRNPWALWVGGVTAVVVGALALTVVMRVRRRRADGLAELLGSVAMTDDMSGTDFEHWVAGLMRRSGFTNVRVSGGAGDRGADLVALTPYGERAVVQCKRYAPHRKVTSPDVQRFAGTARPVHGADLALLVTTGGVTLPAARLAEQLDITVVARTDLMEWATHGRTPLGD